MPDEPLMLPAVPAGTHYEVELDDPPEGRPVLVDAPAPDIGRRPLIPPQARAAASRSVALAGYRAAYHALRSPRYLLLTILWAVAGAVRLTGRWLAWWLVFDGMRLAWQAAKNGDDKAWHAAHKQVRSTAATRAQISFAVLICARV